MKYIIYLVLACFTVMVGYTIHSSIFWCILDWLFWPIALVKWVICQQITLSILKETFSWFFT